VPPARRSPLVAFKQQNDWVVTILVLIALEISSLV
jgi:hypothetical protein